MEKMLNRCRRTLSGAACQVNIELAARIGASTMTCRLIAAFAVVVLSGCGGAPAPWEQCDSQFKRGKVYAGQDANDFSRLCRATVVSEDGAFTTYLWGAYPNHGGRGGKVIAKNGRLVRGSSWEKVYFDTMTDEDRTAYGPIRR